MFQSRSGFSPCLDVGVAPGDASDSLVSIPFWAFSLSRQGWERPGRRHHHLVLIPFWVFSLPRPDRASTNSDARPASIPSWVFSLLRRRFRARRRVCRCVSIPFWVFSLPRQDAAVPAAPGRPFQSRSGFSPCLDVVGVAFADEPRVFQSRSGFSPCLDLAVQRRYGPADRVSIPSWVFSLLRQTCSTCPRLSREVSIPFWVFSLPRRTSVLPWCCAAACFNPVLGFLPASTLILVYPDFGLVKVSIPF